MLKARLQPHFLFNTLHTIGSLVRLDHKQSAIETLSEFGDLLRHSLDHSGRRFVALDEELKFIRKYLAIEQRRFSDRLEISFCIEPEAEQDATREVYEVASDPGEQVNLAAEGRPVPEWAADLEARKSAHTALAKEFGANHGYDPEADIAARRVAARKWQTQTGKTQTGKTQTGKTRTGK